MANNIEGQLVDIWNEEEESTGLKGWLEENISKKGITRAGKRYAGEVKKSLAEIQGKDYKVEAPGLGIAENVALGPIASLKSVAGVSKKLLEIAKRTKPGKSTLSTINARIGKYPKDKPWMAIAVDEEKRILQTLPEEMFENKELLRKAIDKGEDFISGINKTLGKSGQMYDESYIKDVLDHLYKSL